MSLFIFTVKLFRQIGGENDCLAPLCCIIFPFKRVNDSWTGQLGLIIVVRIIQFRDVGLQHSLFFDSDEAVAVIFDVLEPIDALDLSLAHLQVDEGTLCNVFTEATRVDIVATAHSVALEKEKDVLAVRGGIEHLVELSAIHILHHTLHRIGNKELA